MKLKTINVELMKSMLESGSNNLSNHKEEVNSLNVFPVPDGDTGSNMAMTAISGTTEAIENNTKDVPSVMKSFSRGLLLGARGNSGVIFSQIFKGISSALTDKTEELTVNSFNTGILNARVTAYEAVMKPVEGTILTVIRQIGEALIDKVTSEMTFEDYFKLLIKFGDISVKQTPNLLPVLKDVGVVDSGGYGLMLFFKGMQQALLGKPIKNNGSWISKHQQKSKAEKAAELKTKTLSGNFGYCTEFIIIVDDLKKLSNFNKARFVKELEKYGSSIVVVNDENIIKVHIHAKKPGSVLNFAQKIGYFQKIKIDNMTLQVSENHKEVTADQKNTTNLNKHFELDAALIAVANGQGLIEEFRSINVNHVVGGGQTMNPSAKDFIDAIEKVNAKTVYILPNNSNIILAAEQAAAVETRSKVIVLPTKTIMQGMLAAMYFNANEKIKTNRKNMRQAIKTVKSAAITIANRDVTIKRVKIKKGQFLGIFEKDIVVSCNNIIDTIKRLLKKMITEESEIITLFYGVNSNLETANKIKEFVESNYEVEVEIKQGDQEVYHFIIGVE